MLRNEARGLQSCLRTEQVYVCSNEKGEVEDQITAILRSMQEHDKKVQV